MDHGSSMTLEHAREMAEALVGLLAPACERIEIAGSIRRRKPNPNDIELVAVPREEAPLVTLQQDMFSYKASDTIRVGPCNLLNTRCDDLLRAGILEKRPDSRGRYCWGTGIKRAIFYRGEDYAPVDLFQAVPPAEWGVIYAIRTGPGDFNRLLVTNRWLGGACPKDRKVAGGRVWNLGFNADNQRAYARMPASKFVKLAEKSIFIHLVPTPREESFFEALEVPCWPPEERTEQQLREYLRQTRMK